MIQQSHEFDQVNRFNALLFALAGRTGQAPCFHTGATCSASSAGFEAQGLEAEGHNLLTRARRQSKERWWSPPYVASSFFLQPNSDGLHPGSFLFLVWI